MQPAATTASCPPRILIADDTPQAAELLEAYLADGDYDVAHRQRRRTDACSKSPTGRPI